MAVALVATALPASAQSARSADTNADHDGVTSMPGFNPATHVPLRTPTLSPSQFRGGPAVLYTNGPLATGPTSNSGMTVPTAGYEWSEVQNDTGNTTESNTLSGSSCSVTATTTFRCADDFDVPAGATWTVSDIVTYGYQTGYAGATTPYTEATIQIWDGPPNDPTSTVIAGDEFNDALSASVEANLYRIFNSAVPAPGATPGTTRRVWRNTLTLPAPVALTEGTYWVSFNMAVGTSANFTPPVTVIGSRDPGAGNGLQFSSATSAWTPLVDTGNPASAPDVPQAFPFEVLGTSSSVPSGPGFCAGTNVNTPEPGGPTAGAGPFGPYPVEITVPMLPAGFQVSDVNVHLINVTHTFPDDLDLFVEHPLGPTAIVMSDVGGGDDIADVTLVIDDEGATALPTGSPLAAGTYQPANYGMGDLYDAPAPTPAENTLLSVFDGADPMGVWKIWGDDDASGDTGDIGNICIEITISPIVAAGDAPAGATALTVAPNPTAGMARVRLALETPADHVTVALFDALGRQVATLHDGAASGTLDLALDTRSLPAGVYVVRATGGELALTTRVTVTR